jgi:hypothetical protein
MKTITHNILMVRPAKFGFNEQTAASNTFQTRDDSQTAEQIQQQAQNEFDLMVMMLRSRAINVVVAQDTKTPVKPDAVFPNNWVTFHEDGTTILYPMFANARRKERREPILKAINKAFEITKQVHLEHYEGVNQFLEGTGSMILDRANEIVYACLSPRTDVKVLDELCEMLHYKRLIFNAVDDNQVPIYHTNVMMALGETFAIVCLATIPDPNERANLIKSLEQTKKEIIEISLEQMKSFAGNMLQVGNQFGETFLVMSETARHSLNDSQIKQIKKHTQILSPNIQTIEKYGGGSARCMMAEIFLPRK